MKITKWDMADNITTTEDITTYLSAALEEGEAADVINVIGAIARSKGMTKLAREAGVTREALYTSLSANGNPSFITVLNILRSLGIVLQAQKMPTAKLPETIPVMMA
ncbi:putative addiction module antidote protein [Treponema socranskii]|uniref:addiction module antidote protein n=1 Tax=Treponema socranskii TaxID=53419 RepID=UPI003D94D52C